MKKIFIIIPILFALAGCSTIDRALLRPVLVTNSVPQIVTIYVTNSVPMVIHEAVTNADHTVIAPIYITNTVVQPYTITQPPITVITTNGFTVAPAVDSVSNVGGALLNTVAPGFGGLLSNGLLALAGLYAAYRGRQYKKTSELANDAAVALVKGIEGTRVALKNLPPDTKILGKTVDEHLLGQILEAVGKSGELAAFVAKTVEENTGNTNVPKMG